MKHGNIFWGVTLITIGFLFLFDKLEIIYFEWSILWRLWPVLLILWGVAIMPLNGIVKTILALLVAALTIGFYYQKTKTGDFDKPNRSIQFFHHNDRNDDDTRFEDQTFSETMPDSIRFAKLSLDAAAGSFSLDGTCAELFQFSKEGHSVKYSYRMEEMGDLVSININQETDVHIGKNNRNNVSFLLNPEPIWDFDFDIGAADFRFDMRNFKVRDLKLDGGAASIDLKIGDLNESTNINISAAASSIDISVPEKAGCRIEGSSVLSSRDLDGFDKIEKGVYETPGYESASQQITINIDAAVSSFTVKRQ